MHERLHMLTYVPFDYFKTAGALDSAIAVGIDDTFALKAIL